MNMSEIKSSASNAVRFKLQVGSAIRRVELQRAKAPNNFVLPDGVHVYISDEVIRLLGSSVISQIGGNNLNKVVECINKNKCDRLMVPIIRIGAGPTEKSARFSVKVIQTNNDTPHEQDGNEKVVTLNFTLPVSQIESVGGESAQIAAPLWLIKEKLLDKSSSKSGTKSRFSNSALKKYTPANIIAVSNPKVDAFKAWIENVCEELLGEDERDRQSVDLLESDNKKVAAELFQQFLTTEIPTIKSFMQWRIKVHAKHGKRINDLFKDKVLAEKVLSESS